MRLTKGDYLNVLDKSADGWWRVSVDSGTSGWIPSNYVDETNAPPPSNSINAPSHESTTNGGSQMPPLQPYNYNNGMSGYPSTQVTNFSTNIAGSTGGRVLEVSILLRKSNTHCFRLLLLCIVLMPKIRKNCRLEKVNK